jgi:hypothetical protein
VKALEERLAPLRREPPPLPPLVDRSPALSPGWRRLFVAAPLLLAASLLLAAGLAYLGRKDGWEVRWSGERTSRLGRGEWIETGRQRARLAVGRIGSLDLEPGTRLGVLSDAPSEYRVALARGTVHARISAPPRRFLVETPVATAIDLGCAYTLSTDEQGNGRLRVSAGWVSFERKTPDGVDEVVVPAGASCRVSSARGPGSPAWDDASPAFLEAHARLEAEGEGVHGGEAIAVLLREARAKDGLTLLALAADLAERERASIFDRLAALSPAVARLPRDPFVAGEPAALAATREALALPMP